MADHLTLTVNGEKLDIEVSPSAMLVDVLRDQIGLIGTKIGCREGECGACTILLDGAPVNSCLVPALKVQGKEVKTIEGLDRDNALRIQETFAEEGAVQCGYCTPGFVVATFALLEQNPSPADDEIRQALAGNLCRCGAYTRIISAIQKVSDRIG